MRPSRPAPPDAPICQAKANSDKHAECICDPIVHVCAAVESGLYQLKYGAEGVGTDEDGDYPEPASAGQGEGKGREGNQMYQPVAPLGRWGRRLKRPENRGGYDGRHDHGEGYRDICAFPASTCAACMAQA